MFQASENLLGAVASMVAQDVALTSPQKAAVKAEIQGDPEDRGYASATPEELVTLLSARYDVPNPDPQGRTIRDEWLPDELKNTLLDMPSPDPSLSLYRFVANLGKGDGPFAGGAADFLDALSGLKAISMSHPRIDQGFKDFRDAQLLSPEGYDFLTTEPDPAWKPVVQKPSALERLGFPERAMLTGRDVAEALA